MTILTVKKIEQLNETEKIERSDYDLEKRLENDQKTTRKRPEKILDNTQKAIMGEIEIGFVKCK